MVQETPFKRLVIAAYRLPFKFSQTKKGYKAVQNSGGLVSAILALSESFNKHKSEQMQDKILWVGHNENLPDDFDSTRFENNHFDIAPVKLTPQMNELYYGGFCNDLLWPLFHYFPSYSVFNSNYFEAYVKANELFCDELVKHIRPGDYVWIHDYQLMLLPEMLRKRVPEATIGFFLHIPFPSFEIFRLLPRQWRSDIINGMLGADLVGFHTHDYTQHFLKSVKRTVGYECRQNTIYTPSKIVKADAFPIGIDYHKFHDACMSKKVIKEKEKIKEHLQAKKLVFSVDRLDYSKGLLLRLQGYELFLEKYPQWHGQVVFNMVIVPSRDNIGKYKEMKREIEYTVGHINGKYSSLSWRPIIYQYKSLTFDELVALYDLSDVGLITPLRDGMNLVAKEYVACQLENRGVLILSEMAGAAAELNEAVIINPADTHEMADAVCHALEMAPEEKHIRLERMQKRIETYNVFTWALDFFNQTHEVIKEQKHMAIRYYNKSVASQIVAKYKAATKRIIFLDYDGTLVSIMKFPEMAILPNAARILIDRLASDPQNSVVVISGRDRQFLETQFKGLKVMLVAEHGYFIKTGEEWQTTIDANLQWKATIMPILQEYVNRCNGTFIEEKTGSLAWHYRNADSDYAQLRLNELKDDLADIIRYKTDFEILEGSKVLEVKSGKYDKGQAATNLLKKDDYDFVLAVGDDKTDEYLFSALPSSAITIRIGSSPTVARYNMVNQSMLTDLLTAFVE
jgi:trehalose 6-phosphate synthase/phosphatase